MQKENLGSDFISFSDSSGSYSCYSNTPASVSGAVRCSQPRRYAPHDRVIRVGSVVPTVSRAGGPKAPRAAPRGHTGTRSGARAAAAAARHLTDLCLHRHTAGRQRWPVSRQLQTVFDGVLAKRPAAVHSGTWEKQHGQNGADWRIPRDLQLSDVSITIHLSDTSPFSRV